MNFKSGFVNIIGNPNVGKSTLMNAFTGERMSIVTPKAQTTRHRILGIVNGPGFQAVFSDTPGILKPVYKLQESMMSFVKSAITDADVLLYVTDVVESAEKNSAYIEKLAEIEIPVLLLINKVDLSDTPSLEKLVAEWRERLPRAEIYPVSAKQHFQIGEVMQRVITLLPEGAAYFPEDELTDKPERFFVSEILREKIFLYYQEEIPYCTEVVVETFKEEENLIRIQALILVERDTQKGILIGKQGSALKRTNTQARLDMEKFFGKKVYLEVFVKVESGWRNSERNLRRLGYIES